MEKAASLLVLIETEAEPTFSVYEKVLRHVVDNPRHLSQLVEEDSDKHLVFNLSTRHRRLARFFKALQQNELIRKSHAPEIAESIVIFLAYVIPSLSDNIDNKHIINALEPALAFCFPHRAPGLQRLAIILTSCERLLEDLVCGPGQKFILQWIDPAYASSPEISILDKWTSRFVELVEKCPTDHGVMREVSRYKASSELRIKLQEEKCTLEA
ncbi:MAG: hypothetical protein Q9214_006590, partial [Letrouitia sp. 1 TL-2023]